MATPEAASSSCACFSFCTIHEATASLARIPTTLYAASPWLKYLRRVYGSSYEMVEGGAIVDELDRLQFIYARGLPIARCGPARPSRPSTVRQLSRRLDPLCERSACAIGGWYAEPPIISRPPLRGLEPYYWTNASGTIDNIAYRWWWRPLAVQERLFARDNGWVEVVRWPRRVEGYRAYSFWYAVAAGSGIWLYVGNHTVSHLNKLNVSKTLAARYRAAFGALPSERAVAREVMGKGEQAVPLAFVANRLGISSVQTIQTPTMTSEIVATDAASVADAAVNTPKGGNACGEAPLRTGPKADQPCHCQRDAPVINCAEVSLGWGGAWGGESSIPGSAYGRYREV